MLPVINGFNLVVAGGPVLTVNETQVRRSSAAVAASVRLPQHQQYNTICLATEENIN